MNEGAPAVPAAGSGEGTALDAGTADRPGGSSSPVSAPRPEPGAGPGTPPEPSGTVGSTEPSGPVVRSGRFHLGNRPPLTGIRALALFTVLTYHSNFKTLPGTWASIQVFFVLSGFLITAMLAGEGQRKGRISLGNFYARRGVRLLPPLVLTVVLLGIYALVVHVADASQRVWGDSLATLFYYADYRQALGHAPFFGYLAQTWSLSIEEQFYILWSILMVAAVAAHRHRLAYWFAGIGIAASVADRLYLVYHAAHFDNAVSVRVYYAFDSRADALFLGCVLGLLAADGYLQNWPRWARGVITAAAAGCTVFFLWVLFEAPLFTENLAVWWLPTTAVASAVILTYFVICPTSLGSKFVGLGVLVFIGDMTYTAYLVHFPVYLAIEPSQTGWSYWPNELVRLAIIFAIAVASWYGIEKPLARWRRRAAASRGAT